jgi:ATP-dependent RNA helicase RhlB
LKREDWSRALIFVNTKVGVERLTHRLKGNGWPAEGITGDLPQRKRFRLMEQFKKGQLKILVATDVASRGIHVEDISHVINYDLPQDSENYVHRIGRTARAGKTGRALSLACERYVFHLESIEEWLGNKIPIVWPEDDWLVEDQSRPMVPRRKTRMKSTTGRRIRGVRDKRVDPRKARQRKRPSHFPGAFFGFGPEPESPAKKETSKKTNPSPGKKSSPQRKKETSAS